MGVFPLRALACTTVALASAGAWSDDTIQLSQRVRIEPGSTISAALPALLTTPTVSSSAPAIVGAEIVDGNVMITAKRQGTATVTFSAAGLSDLLADAGAAAPRAGTGAAASPGYSIRETVDVEVSPAGATSPASPASAARPGSLSFRRSITLAAGETFRARLPNAVRNTSARSSAPQVQATATGEMIAIAAAADATGAADVHVLGDGPSSLLDFGSAGGARDAAATGYRFDEAIAVTISPKSQPPSGSTAPPAPLIADNSSGNAPGKRPPSAPGKGRSGDAKKPEDARKADDSPAPRYSSTNLTLRMGERSTASLPAHARVQTIASSDTHVAKAESSSDSVDIVAMKPGSAEITVEGDMLRLDTDTGGTVPFKQVVHLQVTGPDLSGRWVNLDGTVYTIAHNGNRVLLYDGLAHPWQGSLDGRTLQLSHVYSREDVGKMNQGPPKVQEQLVGHTRRISATVKGDDDATIAGTLHGIHARYTEKTQVVRDFAAEDKPLQLRRSP